METVPRSDGLYSKTSLQLRISRESCAPLLLATLLFKSGNESVMHAACLGLDAELSTT